MIDKSFWKNPSLVKNKDVFNITFRQVVEVPTFPKEISLNSKLDPVVNMLTMINKIVEQEKPIEEYANNPNDTQFEEKYNHLYNEYMKIKKQRDDLKRKVEKSEICKDLTQKEDSKS